MRRKREELHLSVLRNDELANDNIAAKRNLYEEPFHFNEKEHSKEEKRFNLQRNYALMRNFKII